MFSIFGRSRNEKPFLILKMNTETLDLDDRSSDMALDRIIMMPFDSCGRKVALLKIEK